MTRARITRIALFRAQFATVLLALRLLRARMAETRVTDAVATPGGPSKRMPCDGSVANIEDGERLRSTIEHVMATLPRGAHSGRLNEVDIMNGNNAFFMFATVSDGSVVSASLRGRVVRIKGRLKVSRETHCQAIGFSGISCPPR